MFARMVLLLAALLAGCQVPTQALVFIDGDPRVRTRTRALCVIVYSGRREEGRVQYSRVVRVPEDVTLPTRPPIHPLESPNALFTVEARGCRTSCDDCFVTAHATDRFRPGERSELQLHLSEACVGVPCDAALTCLEGECVLPDVTEDGELPLPSDAQPESCAAGSSYCFENPRPGPGSFDACVGDAFAALSTNYGLLTNVSGVWEVEHRARLDFGSMVCLDGGVAVAAGQRGSLLERGPDGVWTNVDVGTTENVGAAGGGSEAWAWAAGGDLLVRRLGPGRWEPVAPPADGMGISKLVVASDGSEVWAIRVGGLLRFDGATWEPIAPPPGLTEWRAAMHAGGLALVGNDALHTRVGGVWSSEPLPCVLTGVAGASGLASGELLISGARGDVITRRSGGALECVQIAVGQNLRAVGIGRNAAGEVEGYVGSFEGNLLHWTGERIRPAGALAFVGEVIDLVARPGSAHGFLGVGRTNYRFPLLVERIDAEGHWRRRALPIDGEATLLAVDASETRAVAVGSDGVVVERREDGAGWVRAEAFTAGALHAVAHSGERWVVGGEDGIVFESIGREWIPVTPPLPGAPAIRALAIDDAGAVWVGTQEGDDTCDGGAVHRLRAGAWETLGTTRCAISDLGPIPGGGMWVAGRDLFRWDGAALVAVTLEDGTATAARLFTERGEVVGYRDLEGRLYAVLASGGVAGTNTYSGLNVYARNVDADGRAYGILAGRTGRIARRSLD